MSLVEEFFKQYDELASKYEKYTEIFKNQGAERPAEVAKEARESFIESITDAGIKTKKPSKRRVAIKKYYQERAWLLGI
nr:MAG TPA: KIP1-like protein [Caudoviricetes sp.]